MISLSDKIIRKLKDSVFRGGGMSQRIKSGFRGTAEQTNLDKKLVFSLAKSRWPSLKQLKYIKRYLSRVEKFIISGCLTVIFLSILFLAAGFYKTHLQVIPVDGGDYVEGVIGSINYVNPLYSNVSDVDSDIVRLVYSSLFGRDENGRLENDLAENYSVSQDGKAYTVKVRADARWHNGSLLTVDDIIFTFQAIKNPDYKSPLRAGFSGVAIEKVDEETIRFNLAEPYAAFLNLLTFGVLPQELWQQIEPAAAGLAEFNLKPVGSGRYKFKSLVKDRSGNIRAYNLIRNGSYYGDKAHIENISFKLFGNITEMLAALNNNLINGASYLPELAKSQVVARDSLNFHRLNLPKLSIIFFNAKNNAALADKKVRQALAYAIDKNKVVSEAVGGSGRVIDSPILPESFAYYENVRRYDYNTASSSQLLAEAGWKTAELTAEDINQAEEDLASDDEEKKNQARLKINMGEGKWLVKDNNYLILELTTVDNPEYVKAAESVAGFWQAVNVKVGINLVAANQIQTDAIRNRNFAALFYSEIAGADPDSYAFWHSSQIGQTGLNIADYVNKDVDKLLEDGRLTLDEQARREKYQKFQEILSEDEPVIFLYSPYYTYLQSKNIKGFNVKSIISPSDRFAGVGDWYIKTGKKIVW